MARRALPLLLAAILGGIVTLVVAVPGTSHAVTKTGHSKSKKTVYSKTVSGSDARALNPHYLPVFMVGGGVAATDGPTNGHQNDFYFEAPLDLPTDAKVTSITISYAGDSDDTAGAGTYYVGSYAPTTLATRQVFSITPPITATQKTVTKTGDPLLKIEAGRRYVIDWEYPQVDDNPVVKDGVFYGAIITYTCAGSCVP